MKAKNHIQLLHDAQLGLHQAVEVINQGVVSSTPDGKFLTVNPGMCTITGLEQAQLLNLSWGDLVGSLQANNILQPSSRGIAETYRITDGNGQAKTLSVTSYCLGSNGNRVIWSIVQDITSQLAIERELIESKHKYQLTIAQANIGIIILDLNGSFLDANREFLRIIEHEVLDQEASPLAHSCLTDYIHAQDVLKYKQSINCLLTGDLNSERIEIRIKAETKLVVWVNLSLTLVTDLNCNPQYLIGIVEDITTKKLYQLKLEQAEMIYETTREGIILFDQHLRILRVNQAFAKIFGYQTHELVGRSIQSLNLQHTQAKLYAEIASRISQTGTWSGELTLTNRNNLHHFLLININSIRDLNHRIIQYLGVITDISLLKHAEDRISFLAHHDALTGLPARHVLVENIQQAIEATANGQASFALLFIDLDEFKQINDTFGHDCGDKLLKLVASRLMTRIRDCDTLCRIGGDEFVLLLHKITDLQAVNLVALNLLDSLHRPFKLYKNEICLTASIGIALFPEDGNSSEELLQAADTAMYRAKKDGGDLISFARGKISHAGAHRQLLLHNIRDGLINKQFVAYFQPIINSQSLQIVSFESLVRWDHPQMGLLLPERFIPLLAETGMIIELSKIMLHQALEQFHHLITQHAYTGTIAINISKRELESEAFYLFTHDMLQHFSLLHQRKVVFEIIEESFISEGLTVSGMLEKYRQLGIVFAIDDFGTAYSSLSYLTKLPIEQLKIDKSFIDEITTKVQSLEVTKAIIALGVALDLKIVAEGVEQTRQIELLAQFGCHLIQGYYYSQPIASHQLTNFYQEFNSQNNLNLHAID